MCVDELTPIITKIINLSLKQGCVAASWKRALLRPNLKKPGLKAIYENFRPVNNLQFVLKIEGKAVVSQLLEHCEEHVPLPVNQSAYRKFHSTETAVVKVQNDILISIDQREETLLVLLDLSTAFDTVDHKIMLEVLELEFGVSENMLQWIKSYQTQNCLSVLTKSNQKVLM